MNQEVHDILNNMSGEEFEKLFDHILARVVYLVDSYPWRDGIIPNGLDPEDIAIEIIRRTYEGSRQWDPSKVSFKVYLRNQAKSLVRNLWEVSMKGREVHVKDDEMEIEDLVDPKMTSNEPTPEKVLIDLPEESEIITIILDAVSNDPDLTAMLNAIIEGCDSKPQVVADWLNMDIDKVYNMFRRLARLRNKIEAQLSEKGKEEV